MAVTLAGIACATDEAHMGLAHGVLDSERLRILRATSGSAGESAAATVAGWLHDQQRYVVAMDAPLGWPAALGEALVGHRAGDPLPHQPTELFRRATDRFVADTLRRTPPDVGADRIARTALAALQELSQLRRRADVDLPLAWRQGEESGVIEVYPPATLRAHGRNQASYRGQSGAARAARAQLIEWLQTLCELQMSTALLVEEVQLLDAVLSVLAAADFARGHCYEPEDVELARREGFIWVRDNGQRSMF